jgi:hypothetical protein
VARSSDFLVNEWFEKPCKKSSLVRANPAGKFFLGNAELIPVWFRW